MILIITIYIFPLAKKVFSSSDEVLDLFRFLQLLCEGHNEGTDMHLQC